MPYIDRGIVNLFRLRKKLPFLFLLALYSSGTSPTTGEKRRGPAPRPPPVSRGWVCGLTLVTDKASMLEEIIEYIKFLQLQTKVLSMSRLGATEAVAPLLMESQDESSGLLLGSPRSRSQPDEDSAALEQEVAQLMENNMTMAMQYLQTKGLCLMPIGLASALSTQKGTASAAVKPETTGAVAHIPTVLKTKTM